MRWDEVRVAHPDRWLVIEAIAAHTLVEGEVRRRILDDIVVVDLFEDGNVAWRRCWKLQREDQGRELYAVHSSNLAIEIIEEFRPLRFYDVPHA